MNRADSILLVGCIISFIFIYLVIDGYIVSL